MAVLPLLLAPPRAWWVASLSPDARIGLLETFPKQTFRNRIRIQQRNGVLLDISLPIVHDAGRTTANVRLEKSGWERSLWRSLTAAYAYTPFWEVLSPELEPLLCDVPDELLIYSQRIQQWMAWQWGGTLPVIDDSKTPDRDFSPKKGETSGAGGLTLLHELFIHGPALYL